MRSQLIVIDTRKFDADPAADTDIRRAEEFSGQV